MAFVADMVLPPGATLCKTTLSPFIVSLLIHKAELLPLSSDHHHRPRIYQHHNRAAIYRAAKPGSICYRPVNITAFR